MNSLVSIIVPVYNIESYLPVCLSSIANQTYEDIEIILIDDGSTDSSASICDAAAANDSRFRIVHKENAGVSDARNTGMELARGLYITFVDGDDVLLPNYIESMMQCAKNSDVDIVCCNIIQWSPSDGTTIAFPGARNSNSTIVMNPDLAIEKMLRNRLITSGPYAKLIRRKIVDSERFSKLVIAEDLEFNFRIFNKVKKIAYCDSDVYKYRQTPDGAMRKPFTPSRMDAIKSIESVLRYAVEHKTSYKRAAEYRLIRAALHCAGSMLDSRQKRRYEDLYRQCRSIIRGHVLSVAVDSDADLRMRVISSMAAINLPLSWKITTTWHKMNALLKLKTESRNK